MPPSPPPMETAPREREPTPVAERIETQSVAPQRTEWTPPAPRPEPQAELDTVLRSSGLVMIETKPNVMREAVTVEEQAAPRPRRERRPPPPDLAAPLVQIETRHADGEAPAPN